MEEVKLLRLCDERAPNIRGALSPILLTGCLVTVYVSLFGEKEEFYTKPGK